MSQLARPPLGSLLPDQRSNPHPRSPYYWRISYADVQASAQRHNRTGALLAFYKMIHYQIPDPSPIEVGREEAAQLAQEVVRSVAAYLPREALTRILGSEHGVSERAASHSGTDFQEAGQLEVYAHSVDGAPGCCVGIGGRLVCVRVAE